MDLSFYRCREVDAYTLYPWVHQYCNNVCVEDQTRPITFPDVSPASLPEDAEFSMAAGDFLEVYTEPGMHSGVTLQRAVSQKFAIKIQGARP